MVLGDGISIDPERIKAVGDWPRSTTMSEIHNFFGLVGYYQHFIKGLVD